MPFFTDVPEGTFTTGNTFFPFIQKMWELGITAGATETTYAPADPIPHWQIATFIARTFFGAP